MELEEIRKTARKNKAGNKTRSILFCMQLVNTNTFKNNQKKECSAYIIPFHAKLNGLSSY